MKNISNKSKAYIVIVLVLFTLLATAVINRKHAVIISVEPEDSRLYLDQKPISAGQLLLKQGEYAIKVERDRYNPFEQKINIPKDKNLNISLIPSQKITYTTKPFNTYQNVETKVGLLAVDRETNDLINYSTNPPRTIYSGKVKIWNYNHPWIAIIDEESASTANIINIDLSQKFKLISPSGRNIEHISVDSLGENIIFLTNANVVTRMSDLYHYSRSKNSYIKHISTNATKVQLMDNDLALLIAEADFNYATVCSILNLTDQQVVAEWKANKCLISEDRSRALIEAEEVHIFTTLTKADFNTSIDGRIVWSENNPMVVQNTQRGVMLYNFSNQSSPQSSLLPIQTFQKVIGATNQHITLLLPTGEITSYLINQP